MATSQFEGWQRSFSAHQALLPTRPHWSHFCEAKCGRAQAKRPWESPESQNPEKLAALATQLESPLLSPLTAFLPLFPQLGVGVGNVGVGEAGCSLPSHIRSDPALQKLAGKGRPGVDLRVQRCHKDTSL